MEVVSIIMPAYNAARTIGESINSVLNQNFTDFRLYIIDDASSDDTVNIVNEFHDQRITLIKNEINLGVAGSRNVGISLCQGEFIAFLDSDDLWLHDKLATQLVYLKDYDVVCGCYQMFDNFNEKLGFIKPAQIITFKNMLNSNFIGNLTGIYNARKIGKVYQEYIGHEDYAMWLKIMSTVGKAYCVQKIIAMYRVSGSSLSANKVQAAKWQWSIYRKNLGFSLIKTMYHFSLYVYNALKKRVGNK